MQTLRKDPTQAPRMKAKTANRCSKVISATNMQWSIGVLEWWSNGVMAKRRRSFRYSNTPLLHRPEWSSRSRRSAFHEPGDPDAAFVKHDHRQAHGDQSQHV